MLPFRALDWNGGVAQPCDPHPFAVGHHLANQNGRGGREAVTVVVSCNKLHQVMGPSRGNTFSTVLEARNANIDWDLLEIWKSVAWLILAPENS